jgi:hypothetical protein
MFDIPEISPEHSKHRTSNLPILFEQVAADRLAIGWSQY